jgi:exodeoxyribonuclease-5
MEFGYAITCHTSQGSEWENVVVLNEVLNKQEHHKWLYTAITRASKKLVIFV